MSGGREMLGVERWGCGHGGCAVWAGGGDAVLAAGFALVVVLCWPGQFMDTHAAVCTPYI